ncbi:hypothetical protein [uncultured Gammaproteobacteria bacterium]|nr:hypothetical protein [uncultured Gammaproteobacteria bacterium]
MVDLSIVIVSFIVINQFVVWFLRVDYLFKGLIVLPRLYIDNIQIRTT